MNFEKLQNVKKNQPLRWFGVAFLLCVMALFVVTLAGCPQSTLIHKAAVAADSIASALNTAATINHEDTMESVADRAALATYIDGLAKLNDIFIGQLQTASANGGQVTAAQIVQAFTALNAQAQTFQGQGLLHLKSADAQAKFANVTTTINGLLQTIQALMPAATADGRTRLPVPSHKLPYALAVLALTPEEIAGLLALLIPLGEQAVTLVEKLTAMKEETDAQLLADAAAQDKQTETIAEGDEAAGDPEPTS
jgi:hypothetical protein